MIQVNIFATREPLTEKLLSVHSNWGPRLIKFYLRPINTLGLSE